MAIGDGGAGGGITGAEIPLQKSYEWEGGLQLGLAGVIVERRGVALGPQSGAELNDFLSRRNAFKHFNDDLIGREQSRRAALQGGQIEIDERSRVSDERFEAKQHARINDQPVAGVFVGLEDVFAGSAKEEFVGE